MKHKLSPGEQKNYGLFSDDLFIKRVLEKIPLTKKDFLNDLKELKIFPVFVSNDFHKLQYKNIHLIGDAFFAFPPSFAQGASQSIESAYELFNDFVNNTSNYYTRRVSRTKQIYKRSALNHFAFHLSNPLNIYIRNNILKYLTKNKKFLESYLGEIYNIK